MSARLACCAPFALLCARASMLLVNRRPRRLANTPRPARQRLALSPAAIELKRAHHLFSSPCLALRRCRVARHEARDRRSSTQRRASARESALIRLP